MKQHKHLALVNQANRQMVETYQNINNTHNPQSQFNPILQEPEENVISESVQSLENNAIVAF
jgi:hypothetical protein